MTLNLITNNYLYPPPPCWLLKAPGQIWRPPLIPVQSLVTLSLTAYLPLASSCLTLTFLLQQRPHSF